MKGKASPQHGPATRAIEVMAAAEPSPISSQQVAVLVSGSLLMCSWQYVSQGLQHFDSRGVRCLMEAWVVIAASYGLGQLAKAMARPAGLDECVRQYQAAQDELTSRPRSRNSSSSSSSRSSCHQQAVQDLLNSAGEKEGLEVAVATEHQDDAEDEVGVQKRIAQATWHAQAAAKLAEYQSHLRHLLSSINSSSDISSSTDALLKLTEQLFESPMNVCEFVNQGGVPVILNAARSALRILGSSSSSGQAQVLPALLQVSWVLPQVAHGPRACCAAALTNQDVAATLLEVTKAVAAAPVQQQEAKEPVLRNLCWIILLLCDAHNSASRGLASSGLQAVAGGSRAAAGDDCGGPSPAAVACASALCDAGVVDVLQHLVSLQFGPSAGWVAAATLGLFMQLGQQQQQHQGLCDRAAQGMLQPDSLHGLGYLLNHQPQICDRLQGLVYCQVQYLLTHHTRELLRLLVEEHLVGMFATGLPPKLARLLVCQLLSTQGQEVLCSTEESYELDVPLALAQIIPLPIHVKLPPAPCRRQQQQQQRRAEIQPAADGDLGAVDQPPAAAAAAAAAVPEVAAAAEDVYTDILASRLLLQRERLGELLTAFAEDLLEQQSQQQQGRSSQQQDEYAAAAAVGVARDQHTSQQQLTPVCAAVLQLTRHLMSRDLELQAVQHIRGESIDSEAQTSSSSNISSSSVASTSTGSGTELHQAGMAGSVPAGQLPTVGAEAAAVAQPDQQEVDQQLLTLPALPAAAAVSATGSSSSGRSIVFNFCDGVEYTVSSATYKQIRSSSKMINSILSRDGRRPARPITVFKTPSFSPMANKWVLQCLERWLSTSDLRGCNARQAAKLWVAADFWQVDGLQVACEDVIIAAAAAAAAAGGPAESSAADSASYLHLAFEICAQHPASSSRLRRLAVQILLRRVSVAYGSNAQHAAAAVDLLQQLLRQYKVVLLPSLLAELRDRLVTMCMLNAGLDADTPHDMVE